MSWLLCHYCRSPDSSDVGCIGGQPTSNNDTGARVTVDRSVELPGICWFATNFYWTDQFLPTNFASANFNWPNLYVVLQITIDLHGAWLSLIFQIFSTVLVRGLDGLSPIIKSAINQKKTFQTGLTLLQKNPQYISCFFAPIWVYFDNFICSIAYTVAACEFYSSLVKAPGICPRQPCAYNVPRALLIRILLHAVMRL